MDGNGSSSFDWPYVLFYRNTDSGTCIRSRMGDMSICHAEVFCKDLSLKSLCSRLSLLKFMLYNEGSTKELTE